MALNRGCAMLFIFGMAIVGVVVGFGLQFARVIPAVAAYPLPHHIAKYPDGVTLRFAMVHDVLHERYPVHGRAYYEERNRRVQQALAQAPAEPNWNLVDDLAVGLDRLGRHSESVAMMRKKLARQQQESITGSHLYSSYANLGTFLILWQLDEGFADLPKAKERIRESIDLVHKSIAVKPDAHFGREVWQAVLEEWLLAFLDDPQLLLKFDMVGNRLDAPVNPQHLRPLSHEAHFAWHREAKRFLRDGDSGESRTRIREYVARVGAENDWSEAASTSHHEPTPFDEPTLGIIGMWRYGGGANPHFSLALAETMLRVGQRYIAWCGYERTVQLAGGVPEVVRAQFIQHCRDRQKIIEDQLPEEEVAKLRPRFEAELKFGQDYQAAYQKYEAGQIAAGASIDDPRFYDAFQRTHGDIASPVGQEDQYVVEHEYAEPEVQAGVVVLSAGVFAFAAACLVALLAAFDRRAAAARDSASCP